MRVIPRDLYLLQEQLLRHTDADTVPFFRCTVRVGSETDVISALLQSVRDLSPSAWILPHVFKWLRREHLPVVKRSSKARRSSKHRPG